MAIVNTIDNIVFELNGIRYPKIFIGVGVPVGSDDVMILNIYDNTTQLLPAAEDFNNFTVDGNNSWTDVAEMLAALQPITSGTVVQAQTFAALTDTAIAGIASDDILQWNGVAWENRAELMLSDTLRISAIAPSINFTGAVGNIISDNTLGIEASSGDISLTANSGGTDTINFSCDLANVTGTLRVADGGITPVAGDIRYNSGLSRHEGFDGAVWNAMY